MKPDTSLLPLARTLALVALVVVGSTVLQGETNCDVPQGDDDDDAQEGPVTGEEYDFVYYGGPVTAADPIAGTCVFSADGTFEDDATHPTDGHYLSGGTWEEGSAPLAHTYGWFHYDNDSLQEYAGPTFTCDWDGSAAVQVCTDGDGWTKEYQTP